jgi:predicted TIM-barrel fold metal-dependent hydrolase
MSLSSPSSVDDVCEGPDPVLKAPRLVAPPGTTDSHLHIFGPQAQYPYVTPRKYTPPDASPAAYRALARTLGVERAVLVQPSILGTDNRRQLDAARELGIPARVVVVVPTGIDDGEMQRMREAGARAVRFVASQPGGLPLAELERFSDRLHEFGWHIELMLTPEQLIELEPRIARLRCRTVIDHMAGVQAPAGVDQPAFKALVRLVRGGCWTKLSAAYRLSAEPPLYRDLVPFAAALVRERPDRLIWGSDWPQAYFAGRMPNTTDLFDLLLDWVPNADVRTRILVDNPAALYGF